MRVPRFPSRKVAIVALVWFAWVGGLTPSYSQSGVPLQLDVSINKRHIAMIGSFVLLPDRRIAATNLELVSLGFKSVRPGALEIFLEDIPGVTYQYDAEQQSISITAPNNVLEPVEIGSKVKENLPVFDESVSGAVVNYNLIGGIFEDDGQNRSTRGRLFLPTGAQSLYTSSRVFGPWGTLSNTGFLTDNENSDALVRLETTWSWSDLDELRSWYVGDVISNGPAWSRPLRLGGVQVRRNFSLRPDLVTVPLPSISGSAAVPSSVDVFVDNVKTYGHEVNPGPFTLSNLPFSVGSGTANVVIRDATGRESVQSIPFYTSTKLLSEGLLDYSVEAGFARNDYALHSFEYDLAPALSVSSRYGFSNEVTLEGHGEFSEDLINAGAGVSFSAMGRGLVSLGTAASLNDSDVGGLLYAAFETKISAVSLRVSAQRTVGDFNDLASVTYRARNNSSSQFVSYSPPHNLDIATLSFPVSFSRGSMSLSFINRDDDINTSRIVSASFSQPLLGETSLFVSGYEELSSNEIGVFAGLTVPLGDRTYGQVRSSYGPKGNTITSEYSRTATAEPGSTGWRLAASEGGVEFEQASGTYQGSKARLEGAIEHPDDSVRVRANVSGAIVATSDGVFFTSRVDDAFAIVDVGAPDVPVFLENRPAGVTDSEGRALVTGLRSVERNRISIDPDSLPADVQAPSVAALASPQQGRGVNVKLKTTAAARNATIALKRPDGTFVPAGSQGTLVGTEKSFVVGYDGLAFIEDVADNNEVSVNMGHESCKASFAYAADKNARGMDTIVCR